MLHDWDTKQDLIWTLLYDMTSMSKETQSNVTFMDTLQRFLFEGNHAANTEQFHKD